MQQQPQPLPSVRLWVGLAMRSAAAADAALQAQLQHCLAAFRQRGGMVDPRWDKITTTHLLVPSADTRDDDVQQAKAFSDCVWIVLLPWLARAVALPAGGPLTPAANAPAAEAEADTLCVQDATAAQARLWRWLSRYDDRVLLDGIDPDERERGELAAPDPAALRGLCVGDTVMVMVRFAPGPTEMAERRRKRRSTRERVARLNNAGRGSGPAQAEDDDPLSHIEPAFIRITRRSSTASPSEDAMDGVGTVSRSRSASSGRPVIIHLAPVPVLCGASGTADRHFHQGLVHASARHPAGPSRPI